MTGPSGPRDLYHERQASCQTVRFMYSSLKATKSSIASALGAKVEMLCVWKRSMSLHM